MRFRAHVPEQIYANFSLNKQSVRMRMTTPSRVIANIQGIPEAISSGVPHAGFTAPTRKYYSHSIAERQGSMNAICCLKSDLIYSSLREIVPKLELSWN